MLNMVARYATADFMDEEVQAGILQIVCQQLGWDFAALVLRPMDDPGQLYWQFTGEKGAWEKPGAIDGLNQLARRAMAERKLVQWSGWVDDGDMPWLAVSNRPAILCLPVIAGEEALGAILVFGSQEADSEVSNAAWLTALASWLAGGLASSRQIKQLQAANQALERLRLELMRSRDTLRALFDSAPTSMYIVDASHTLLAVNRGRASLASQPPQRLVSRRCYGSLFQRSDPCPGCRVKETLTKGRHTRRIERRELPSGNPVELEISSFPIYNEEGQASQAILFEEDVTEKRRLEASLLQAEKLAAVGQLAAGVAHEINNPLTAVIANAQLLQRELDDAELKDMAALIQQAGERASGVVRELLDLSRQGPIALAAVDVNETLRRALSLVQPRLTTAGIQLSFIPQERLPLVLASQEQLQGVWLNLLINAMDAVQGREGVIKVASWRNGTLVFVTVSDNGQGILPEHLGRIFEPFFTTKTTGQGTGLGLSISHRIIRQAGGDIRVESQPNVGTTFIVNLPVA